MTTKKDDNVIELPGDPFERASQALAAMKALKKPGMAVLTALEEFRAALMTAANAVDASRGITIRMGDRCPSFVKASAKWRLTMLGS